MYEFTTRVDEDGVVYAIYGESLRTVVAAEGVATKSTDGTAIQVGNNTVAAIGLTDVAIYAVEGDTIKTVDKDYILTGNYVVVYKDAATGEITEIYVFDANPSNL